MLKNSITIIAVIMIALIGTFGFIEVTGDPNADQSPTVGNINVGSQTDTTPPAGFPYPTVFNFNYAAIGGMSGGTVGALWLNGKYYFNRWNSTMVYRYNDNGPGGGPGTVADSLTYVGNIRDLATDGMYIYGGTATTLLYRFDPNTMATLKTFTLTGGSTRAVAWDPNRKGFWNTNFGGNIFFHDTNGVLKQTITSALTGKYGMAFDSISTPGTAFLWVWNQGTGSTTNELVKYNIATGAVVNTYIFTLTGTSIGIAGGAEVVVKGNQLLLLLSFQNFAMNGYKLKDMGLPVPSGTWTEQTSPVTTALYSVSAVDDNVAWACGVGGKVVRTTNKGVTWTNVSGNMPTAYSLYNIYAWDANTAVITGVSGSNTSIFQTANGGTNWTTANTHAGFGDNLWMTSPTQAYFVGDPSGGNWDLLQSTNAGLNWSTWATVPTTNTAGTYNNAGYLFGSQVWFPSVGQSHMVYTSNMGANWTTQPITLAEITATFFVDATNGFAAGSSTSPGLLKTTNSGTNWTTVTQSFIGANSVSGLVGRETSWWASLQATTVHTSSNGGANWSLAYTAPAGSFYHINLSRNGSTIWGVRSNGAISRYGPPPSGITPISTTAPDNYALSQNYPNPFNPTTKINFAIPKSGLVTLKVYDVLGKEVAVLVNESKTAGSYIVDFNASSLSSGIYFYKLEVNGFSEVKKMTLLK